MSGHLRESLQRLDAELAALRRNPGVPLVADLPSRLMLQRLGAAEAAAAPPAAQVLEILRAQLHNQFRAGEPPNNRQLRSAPWVMWSGAEKAVLLPGLLEQVASYAAGSRGTLRFLIEAWIRDFAPDAPRIADGGSAIRRLLYADENPRLQQWRTADDRFELFDALRGPSMLAQAILSAAQPVATVLEEAGFADPLRAVSGYLKAVQDEVLRRMPDAMVSAQSEYRTDRVTAFMTHDNALRFDGERIAIARSLCQPWRQATRLPAVIIQDKVKNFLVTRIGNPQVKQHRWHGAQEEAALVRRWLARASLKVFFELIADHAKNAADTSADRQWPYREAFWTGCLEKGFIDDAWLVLGRAVHASARAREALGDAYGRLEGGGVSQNHAVLLFKIGPLTVCEWSNNGKMRAWKGTSGPRMWQGIYSRDDLVVPSLPFPDPRFPAAPGGDTSGLTHGGSASGAWQRRAALLLAQHAGVALAPDDWRIR